MLAGKVHGAHSEVAFEVGRAISEAVSRFGAGGEVIVEGRTASLVGAGPSVSTDIGALVDQWDDIASELRGRRCTEIARKLVQRRRELIEQGRTHRGFSVPDWLAPLGILAAALLAGYGIYRWYSDTVAGRGMSGETTAQAREDEERENRAARVCDATRSRVQRGAMIGPTDVEGWVVELSLLRPKSERPIGEDPRLARFVSGERGRERVVWTDAPSLSKADGAATVRIDPLSLPAVSSGDLDGIRLTFAGTYVGPYFNEAQRIEFARLAAGLSRDLGARYGGLYARCAHHPSHYLGAWFAGPGAGGATAALLFFMGTYADFPHIRKDLLGNTPDIDRSYALTRLSDTTKSLERKRVAELLGPYAGMVAGAGTATYAITFPFNDGNRAARASRGIAEELGVGSGG